MAEEEDAVSRRPATFTKTDLKRAMAVATETGPDYAVRVTRDGALEIYRRMVERDEPLQVQVAVI
jgi:hypothetical protein